MAKIIVEIITVERRVKYGMLTFFIIKVCFLEILLFSGFPTGGVQESSDGKETKIPNMQRPKGVDF